MRKWLNYVPLPNVPATSQEILGSYLENPGDFFVWNFRHFFCHILAEVVPKHHPTYVTGNFFTCPSQDWKPGSLRGNVLNHMCMIGSHYLVFQAFFAQSLKATPIYLLVLQAQEVGNEPFWNKKKS